MTKNEVVEERRCRLKALTYDFSCIQFVCLIFVVVWGVIGWLCFFHLLFLFNYKAQSSQSTHY